jgi:hypothetical protein
MVTAMTRAEHVLAFANRTLEADQPGPPVRCAGRGLVEQVPVAADVRDPVAAPSSARLSQLREPLFSRSG